MEIIIEKTGEPVCKRDLIQRCFQHRQEKPLKRYRHGLLALLLGSGLAQAAPQDPEIQELLSLDIEELIMVNVASKRDEAVSEAPGIISVVTAEEIERFGYRNLPDVLNRQAHMLVSGYDVLDQANVVIRGVRATGLPTQVLILLNGRPVRDENSSSSYIGFMKGFPVEAIEKIEIIRGPGSVLYGSNAMAGVINVITKRTEEGKQAALKFTYGSFSHRRAVVQGGIHKGDFTADMTLRATDIDGDSFNDITGIAQTTGTYTTGEEGVAMTLQASYKNLTFNTYLSNLREDSPNQIFVFPTSEQPHQNYWFDLGYQHAINNDWSMNTNVTLNGSDNFRVNNFIGLMFEANTQGRITDNFGVLFGGSYERLRGEDDLFLPDSTLDRGSIYLQADYRPFDPLKLIAGLQYNKPEMISGDLSPRFAAIYSFDENWTMKLLYGEAFRNATLISQFVNLNVPGGSIGNPDLEPETIETFDVQLAYADKRLSTALTFFYSHQQDLQVVEPVPGSLLGLVQFQNSGEIDYYGIEWEGKWNITTNLMLIGNASFQTNEDGTGLEYSNLSNDWMVKSGFAYNTNRGVRLSMFNSFFGASPTQVPDINPAANVNPPVDSYNLLSANVEINPAELFNYSQLSGLSVSVFGQNLLDEDIFIPAGGRLAINSIPDLAGRGVYLTLGYDF